MSWNADAFEESLKSFLNGHLLTRPAVLRDAIFYSVFSGGKRIRPRLISAVADCVGVGESVSTPLGIALELIHSYTLIHDDLPAMDNDDFRRGKATLHKAFDEATALLSGDALIGLGLDAIFSLPREECDPAEILTAAQILNAVSGARGVIAGQILETETLGTLEDWLQVAQLKTGALFQAAFLLPVCFSEQEPEKLGEIARHLGIAFQIADDLEDPQDEALEDQKNIISIEGRESARERAMELLATARQLTLTFPRHEELLRIINELQAKASR